MDNRTRRLGWGWWVLISLGLTLAIAVIYGILDFNRAMDYYRTHRPPPGWKN